MEKLDYFLFLKKKYISILYNYQEIYDNYEEILESNKINTRYLQYEITSKNNCKKQIELIDYYIQQIQIKIYDNCNHEFVDDLIDITPDKSQRVCYCHKCEYTM
jgi:hypothetical protein